MKMSEFTAEELKQELRRRSDAEAAEAVAEAVKNRRQHILNLASDLPLLVLYDDRKEDEELPRGVIEDALRAGDVTVEEFITPLRNALEGVTK